MARKRTARSGPQPTFHVRFVGNDISPEKITLRQVNDALSAIQDIASGRDPFEEQSVSPDKGIGLVDVTRGSAVFSCVARAPEEAIRNLTNLGQLLKTIDTVKLNDEGDALAMALQPIQHLSDVAKSTGCELQVRKGRKTLFSVNSADYRRISSKLIIKGETTIIGRVQRAGGATEMKSALRIPGRRKLLYCDVVSRDLVRRLGQHLYEEIVATGTATWINRTWRLMSFKISDFSQPTPGDPLKALEGLRNAGLDAWDTVPDPDGFIRELRA